MNRYWMALLWISITVPISPGNVSAAAEEPIETTLPGAPEMGMAIVEHTTSRVAPEPKAGGDLLQTDEIVFVLKQPPSGAKLKVGDKISARSEGAVRLVVRRRHQTPSDAEKVLLVAEACKQDGSLQIGNSIFVPLQSAAIGLDELEKKEMQGAEGLPDATRLNKIGNAALELSAIAKKSKLLSDSLIFRIIAVSQDPEITSDNLVLLSEALTTIATRRDAPYYVREGALEQLFSIDIIPGDKRRQRDSEAATGLLNAFHEWVHAIPEENEYPEDLLDKLVISLRQPGVKDAVQVRTNMDRLSKDIAAYSSELAKAGDTARIRRVAQQQKNIQSEVEPDTKPNGERG